MIKAYKQPQICWQQLEGGVPVETSDTVEEDVDECTVGCPCDSFIRYNDPFAANYVITNCAGLSARLENKWGNLRIGQTGRFEGAEGILIDCVFTVDGLRDAAGENLVDRGADFVSPAPDNSCDIIFILWVLKAGKWGSILADKYGSEIHRFAASENEDFHIVSARLDNKGNIPEEFYSTNGQRPFEGPASANSWALSTGTPSTTQPDNQQRFVRQSSKYGAPYRLADIPSGSIDAETNAPITEEGYYYRVEFYNLDPTPEVFIVKDDFMKTFTSSS